MSSSPHKTLRIVLYEGPGAATLPADDRFATVHAMLEQGYALTRTAGDGPVAPPDGTRVFVVGRFEAAGAPQFTSPAGGAVNVGNLAQLELDALIAEIDQARIAGHVSPPGEWKPWFPVIDYDRCTNCMQCLSFCLFGVYGVDESQHIEVQHSDHCKTNCPACSRVCPEAAIMFPKYRNGPINGDVVSAGDLDREKMKIDISALLGGDVYQMLRQRSERARSRFSKERDADKALNERQKCLTKLAQAGDIPPEVIMALPSPEEIERRAREAKAKAQRALDQSIET